MSRVAEKFEIDLKVVVMAVALVIVAAVGSAYITFLVFSRSNTEVAAIGQEQSKRGEFGPVHQVGEFTVNLMVPQGFSPRFVRTGLVVEVSDKKCISELARRDPQIRDAVISILRTKTQEDIQGAAGMERLRRELTAAISDLVEGDIANVYFTELVVQ
jgi:flagellar FliL protein